MFHLLSTPQQVKQFQKWSVRIAVIEVHRPQYILKQAAVNIQGYSRSTCLGCVSVCRSDK